MGTTCAANPHQQSPFLTQQAETKEDNLFLEMKDLILQFKDINMSSLRSLFYQSQQEFGKHSQKYQSQVIQLIKLLQEQLTTSTEFFSAKTQLDEQSKAQFMQKLQTAKCKVHGYQLNTICFDEKCKLESKGICQKCSNKKMHRECSNLVLIEEIDFNMRFDQDVQNELSKILFLLYKNQSQLSECFFHINTEIEKLHEQLLQYNPQNSFNELIKSYSRADADHFDINSLKDQLFSLFDIVDDRMTLKCNLHIYPPPLQFEEHINQFQANFYQNWDEIKNNIDNLGVKQTGELFFQSTYPIEEDDLKQDQIQFISQCPNKEGEFTFWYHKQCNQYYNITKSGFIQCQCYKTYFNKIQYKCSTTCGLGSFNNINQLKECMTKYYKDVDLDLYFLQDQGPIPNSARTHGYILQEYNKEDRQSPSKLSNTIPFLCSSPSSQLIKAWKHEKCQSRIFLDNVGNLICSCDKVFVQHGMFMTQPNGQPEQYKTAAQILMSIGQGIHEEYMDYKASEKEQKNVVFYTCLNENIAKRWLR